MSELTLRIQGAVEEVKGFDVGCSCCSKTLSWLRSFLAYAEKQEARMKDVVDVFKVPAYSGHHRTDSGIQVHNLNSPHAYEITVRVLPPPEPEPEPEPELPSVEELVKSLAGMTAEECQRAVRAFSRALATKMIDIEDDHQWSDDEDPDVATEMRRVIKEEYGE